MSKWDHNLIGRAFLRLTLAGASAAFLAACSSDTSRFAENPFGVADRTATGSVGGRPGNELLPPVAIAGASGGSAPTANYGVPAVSRPVASAAVTSAPLAPLPGASKPQFSAPSTPSPRLAARATSQSAQSQIATGTARNLARSGNWTPVGGTPITIAQGETAQMISNRYGVPVSSLLAVNGLKSASDLRPGTRLTIPVYDASGKATQQAAVASQTPAPISRPRAGALDAPLQGKTQLEQKQAGQKLAKAKEAREARAKAEKAKADKAKELKEANRKKAEDTRRDARNKNATKPATAVAARQQPQEAPRPQRAASHKPQPVADNTPTGSLEPDAPAKPGVGAKPEFRWPARGRVIQSYRKGGHDGINIAVPEGTSVKAAESGVVAYAGSELKGYGNLVLIRHPNGYVSAYAHNGEINVKRGETVRRGQTIAKSGRTGNVASPQLHFELRKGSTPVDPTEYLAGN